MKKTILTIVLTVVICCAVFGTTLALLVAKTDPITNTFTAGDIEITLKETTGTENSAGNREYKLIPGSTIQKDPTVTVEADSEPCWLFVQLVRNNSFDSHLDWDIADGWTQVSAEYPNVFYREVGTVGETIAADTEFSVFKDNQVVVKSTVTRDQLIDGEPLPEVRIMAMAVQRENVNSVGDAIQAIRDYIQASYPQNP